MEVQNKRPSSVTIAQLEALVAVHRAGGFRAAAGDGDVVALHHQLRRLEKALGVDVFDRARPGRRTDALTSAGDTILQAAVSVVEAMEKIRGAAERARAIGQRSIVVACYPQHVRLFVAQVAHDLKDKVDVDFYRLTDATRLNGRSEFFSLLAHHDVDVAVCDTAQGVPPRTTAVELYKWQLVAMPGRPVASRRRAREPVTVEDLPLDNICCSPHGHRSREVLEEAAGVAGVRVSPRVESDNVLALTAVARRSEAWLVVPDDSLTRTQWLRSLPIVGGDRRPLGGVYSICFREDEIREEVREFAEACRTETAGFYIGGAD